jgi:UDP-N-acetylmuramoylalanine--D-glutamate ligase
VARPDFAGVRVAVAGLGVSGRSSALALNDLGAEVVALDERPALSGALIHEVDSLQAAGIEVVTGWTGRLDPQEVDLLVVSPGFSSSHPVMRDMEGKIWGEIELAWRIAQAPILAVTGTNGKSTTVTLAWQMLRAEGGAAQLCGNIAGSGYPEMALTQAAMASTPDQVLVAEVSSFQLETVVGFRPKAAAITNITPDHLDRHGSFSAYCDAKMRLFAQMEATDTLVWNSRSKLPNEEALSGLQASKIRVDPVRGSKNTERTPEGLRLGGVELLRHYLPQQGEHFYDNVMMAWELASVFAELGEAAAKAVVGFKGLAHRMEVVGEKGGVVLVNNSMCTNPAAAAASIAALGRPQRVLVGGRTKGMTAEDYRPLKEALSHGHQAFLFGQDAQSLKGWLGQEHQVYLSMLEALTEALKSAIPGDAVHLAPGGASSEPYASFRERGEAFKQAAKEWLDR